MESQVVKKSHFNATVRAAIIIVSKQQNLRLPVLRGQTVKNFLWLAWKFDLDQRERKSPQVRLLASPFG